MATGKHLQAIREVAGVRQQALADALGTSRWNVCQLEQGTHDLSRKEVLTYIAALQRVRRAMAQQVKGMVNRARGLVVGSPPTRSGQ